jgi:hypothetical protein
MTLGLALAAIALVPMIELRGFSPRAVSNWELYGSSALPPRELLALLVPFAFGGFWTQSGGVPYVGGTGDSGYVGLLPVALALAAPLLLSRHRREARLWIGIAVIEILLSLGPATPLGTLFYYAPGYSSFQAPLRHLFLVTLCLAVSSGLALAAVTERLERRGFVAAAMSAAALLGGIAFAAVAWRTPDVRALIGSNASYAPWALGWPLGLTGVLFLLVLVGRRLPDNRRGAVAFGVLLLAFRSAIWRCCITDCQGAGSNTPTSGERRRSRIPGWRRCEASWSARASASGNRRQQNQFLLPNLTSRWRSGRERHRLLGIQRYLRGGGKDTSGAISATRFRRPIAASTCLGFDTLLSARTQNLRAT